MRRTTSPPRTFNSRVIIRARASRARVQQGTKSRGHALTNTLRTPSKGVHTVYSEDLCNLVPLSHPADLVSSRYAVRAAWCENKSRASCETPP